MTLTPRIQAANDECHLQQLLSEADGDNAGGAAHAAQVVGHHVRAHLEVVHQHRAQAGRRAKQRAVDHQDVDVPRLQACVTADSDGQGSRG